MQKKLQNQIQNGNFQINQHSHPSPSQKLKSFTLDNSQPPQQFITATIDRQLIQQQEQKKRIRIKQYIQRLKQMSPDQTTLQRIRNVREQMIFNQKFLQKQIKLRIKQKTKSKQISEEPQKKKYDQNKRGQVDYSEKSFLFNNQKHSRRIKTQNYASTILEKDQDSSLCIDDGGITSKVSSRKQTGIQKQKSQLSLRKILSEYEIKQSTKSPIILKSLKKQNLLKLPEIQKEKRCHSQKKIINKKEFKNYLLDLRLKPVKPLSELEKLKRDIKYPEEILREFSRRSQTVQKQIMQRIKEYRKLQQKDKYEKALLKESQIDELLYKNLEIKLACLNIN